MEHCFMLATNFFSPTGGEAEFALKDGRKYTTTSEDVSSVEVKIFLEGKLVSPSDET
jgi:hypothetical protein